MLLLPYINTLDKEQQWIIGNTALFKGKTFCVCCITFACFKSNYLKHSKVFLRLQRQWIVHSYFALTKHSLERVRHLVVMVSGTTPADVSPLTIQGHWELGSDALKTQKWHSLVLMYARMHVLMCTHACKHLVKVLQANISFVSVIWLLFLEPPRSNRVENTLLLVDCTYDKLLEEDM